MPTYDYVCDACKHEFEHFQSITAKPLKRCPECGRSALRRLIGSGGGVIFRGSGFYQTDYRSESYQKAAKSERHGQAKTADTASGKDGKAASEAKSTTATGDKQKAEKSSEEPANRKAS
ncbi:MAG: zinc ribbon domain-containing protein [Planctomycetes bacterium]|nr:zinc ribbon domain-containing protein [Planctomycetota bacterium]